jgi:hypothetical protein
MREVLRKHGVRAGGSLFYGDLERGWRDSGLRLNDLRDAVRELLDRGLLDCPAGAGELEFELTAAGYHYFFEPAAPFASLGTDPAALGTLELARARARAPADSPSRRRAGER